jgi:diguanylate cyclase (GGDEF)-like protein/PAS domain S-box-containing protein
MGARLPEEVVMADDRAADICLRMLESGPWPALIDSRQRMRALTYLFLGGATLGFLVWLLLAPDHGPDAPGILAPIGVSLAVAAVLWWRGERLPARSVPLAVALGTVLIGCDLYFAPRMVTSGSLAYLWVTFYAFSMLSLRTALAELTFVGLTYGAVLALDHISMAAARLAITLGTLTIAGLFIALIVSQLHHWAARTLEREAQLRQAQARFRSAFEDAAIGMALVGLDGRWLRANEALARLTGYPRRQLVGMSFRDLTPSSDLTADEAALGALVSGRQQTHHAEKRYYRADGAVVWVALSVSVVRDGDGRPAHLISQMQDITARKQAERELAQRALHDSLTGLPNRELFADRVSMAIARIERSGSPIAVFFIDLDRFKLVNDSLGHAVGDQLLIEVARRLRAEVRPSDTVARLGGDEFTLLCENTNEKQAEMIAARILKSLEQPLELDGRELFANASVGIAVRHDHHARAEGMLRDADAAMYRAKDQGRARYAVFNGGMRLGARELSRARLGSEPWKTEPAEAAGDPAELVRGELLSRTHRFVGRGEDHVLEQLDVVGVDRLLVDRDRLDDEVSGHLNGDHPAAG